LGDFGPEILHPNFAENKLMSKTRKVPSLIVLAAASIALTFGVAGCSKTDIQNNGAQNQTSQTDQSQNPADTANLAPTDGTQAAGTNPQQPAGQAVQQTDQQAAPAVQQASQEQNYSAGYQNTSYGQPVLQARRPPPPLPQYSQPLCPGNGYLWTPGYWSYILSSGLLLGARRLGVAASSGLPVDARILGIFRRHVSIQLRLLGPTCRLLRRH
jgi:hypothetical protein